MQNRTAPVIAFLFGGLVLLSYFLDSWLPVLRDIRLVLVRWVTIFVAAAFVVGIANLIRAHAQQILALRAQSIYSAVLLLGFLVTFLFGVLSLKILPPQFAALSTQVQAAQNFMFTTVQQTLESAFAALVVFSLLAGGLRLSRQPFHWTTPLFLLATLCFLLGSVPLAQFAGLGVLRQWLLAVPVTAGMRGILLGMAIGAFATSLRVLTGADQPYHE